MTRRRKRQTQYKWRSGFCLTRKVDVSVVGETLESIREEAGLLTAEATVNAARPKNSPIHGCFTWNNDEAGEKYRLWEARSLIRSVRIIREDGRDEPMFIHVTRRVEIGDGDGLDEPGSYYQSTRVALVNLDEWTAAVKHYMGKVTSAQEALADLQRIAGTHPDPNTTTMLAIAAQALATAQSAVTDTQIASGH